MLVWNVIRWTYFKQFQNYINTRNTSWDLFEPLKASIPCNNFKILDYSTVINVQHSLWLNTKEIKCITHYTKGNELSEIKYDMGLYTVQRLGMWETCSRLQWIKMISQRMPSEDKFCLDRVYRDVFAKIKEWDTGKRAFYFTFYTAFYF